MNIEKYIEKLVDRGWEIDEGGYFPNQFTSDQIEMVRTALTEAYEAGRKEKGNCKHEWRCASPKYHWTLYYCVHCLEEKVKTD